MLVPMLGAPTASGKSGVAMALAEVLPLEIVTADAMQVYRGMDIGTAKPSLEERRRVPHHLVDVVPPDRSFSVADYVRLAEEAIAGVLGRGRLPLVVGGTGFYLRALSQGLPTVPAADPAVQAELWEEYRLRGKEALERELGAASPHDVLRAAGNPRRLVRALEIVRRTGRAPRDFPNTSPRFEYDKVVLLPSLEQLRPRIERRTAAMFAAGLVEEVRSLLQRYPEPGTAMQAIGYKEVAEALAGMIDLEEAQAKVVRVTVRYARRQLTWFRREPGAERWPGPAEEFANALRLRLERRLGEL